MEDLNQNAAAPVNAENVSNDTLQPVAQQDASQPVDNNSDTINNTEAPEAENPVQTPADSDTPADNNGEPLSEPVVDYSSMDREALLAAFNELLNDDITRIRNRASAIRNQFNLLNK